MTTTAQGASAPARPYDNNGQYSRTSILRYEKIFGPGYISTGGHETTEYLCGKLGEALRPGARVLDVGSGIGGVDLFLARQYGATVTGIDLAAEMIAIAQERAGEADAPEGVRFLLGDILEEPLDPGSFDVVWSRDALMHIPDKARLFARLYDLAAPGAHLIVTDYARGRQPASPEFEEYARKTGYHLVTPARYGEQLREAGFVDVQIEDATDRFVDILKREADRLKTERDDFLTVFSAQDLDYLVDRWAMKVGFCGAGDMKWGIYHARKKS